MYIPSPFIYVNMYIEWKHESPKVMATLVNLMFAIPELDWSSPGDHFETFAGAMSVTRAEWECGRQAVPYDIELDSSSMNLLTPKGMANALFHVMNLKPGSGKLTAPVCSTFVFMPLGWNLIQSFWLLGMALLLKTKLCIGWCGRYPHSNFVGWYFGLTSQRQLTSCKVTRLDAAF